MLTSIHKFRIVIAACCFALAASFLLARLHPLGDAGLVGHPSVQGALMEDPSVPPVVRTLLTEKCADCHSTQTRVPIYGRFAPVSWLLERDIREGRKHMDLSHWDAASSEEREGLKREMLQEVRSGKMPLPQYLIIHRRARITEADLRALQLWVGESSLQTAAATPSVGAGDATRGKAVFEKRCTGCHALDRDDEGPRLAGVYGRTSGTVAKFPYSDALKRARIVWDDKSLEAWLADPDTLVPGNGMPVYVAKPEERRDLIAYFKSNPTK